MKKQKNYFEEWQMKVLDAKQEKVLGISIHLDQIGETNEGMLQVSYDTGIDCNRISFKCDELSSHEEAIIAGKNHIGAEEVLLDINEKKLSIKGKLMINRVINLNQSFLKPGLMGYYKHIPFLEFYQEVLTLQGKVAGEFCIDGETVDFTDGHYFLQKQWGSKFPNVWLWAQCSGFEKKKDLAIMVGVARLKVLFNYYTAFAIPIYYNDQVEIFSNYNGGHISKLYRYKGYIHCTIIQKDKLLDLKIYGRDEVERTSSKESHGIRDIYECNRVKMEVKISQNGNVLLEDSSLECSIEMGGNTSKLK
ncbi:MAG: hypothetical protein E7231_07365 [Cellulosilyticum sp.]|nr:hypothetical protein [Cellulosilyticum sp.]